MRTVHLLLAAAVVSSSVLAAPAQATPAAVGAPVETNLAATAIDLGTLGGKQSEAQAVDGSVVVGWSQTPVASERHAFAYDLAAAKPTMIDLGTLGGDFSTAEDVSGAVVVGRSRTAAGRSWHAFAYDLAAAEPSMIDLGTLGGEFSEAVAVDGTVVVGQSETTEGSYHAFAYDLAAPEPAMLDLGTLGGDDSEAVAVDGNLVVGNSHTVGTAVSSGQQHAFSYDLDGAEPSMRDLGARDGKSSFGDDVDGTVAVGRWFTAASRLRAFAYDLAGEKSAMRDLGTLGGRTTAVGVDAGVVVGSSFTASPRRLRAYAYDLNAARPVMRDLGPMAGDDKTWTMASAINGSVVIGRWQFGRRGYFPYSFAYDLGAAGPSMFDLSTWRGSSIVSDVDGDVVVGTSDRGPADRATAWVLQRTTRPLFTFQRLERRVDEGVGRVTIRVTRYGRTDRGVSVRYQTHHDTAVTGKDFVGTSGTLRFPAGVTHRRFTVRILDDRRREPAEYFLLGLSHPSDPGRIGRLGWSQVRIDVSDR